MSRNLNISTAAIAIALALASEVTIETIQAARATKAEDRTKDQKLAIIADDITKAGEKFHNVQNDIVVVRAAKAVYVPSVGDKVLATIGRNTATSQSKVVPGTVKAVKLGVTGDDGKTSATQVRVVVSEGTFEETIVTLYPAQLELVKPEDDTASA